MEMSVSRLETHVKQTEKNLRKCSSRKKGSNREKMKQILYSGKVEHVERELMCEKKTNSSFVSFCPLCPQKK